MIRIALFVLALQLSAAFVAAQTSDFCEDNPGLANDGKNLIVCSGKGILIEDAQDDFRRIDLLQIVKTYETTIANLQTRLAAVEQKLQTSETTIAALNATTKEQSNTIFSLNTQLFSLTTQQNVTFFLVMSQHEKLSGIDATLNTSLIGHTSNLQSQLTSVVWNLSKVSSDVAGLKPQVSDLDYLLDMYEFVRLLGGSGDDIGWGIAVDSAGSVFITGHASAALHGSNAYAGGIRDIVVAKFSRLGTLLWVQLLGGSGDDRCWDIAVDSAGSAYIIGEAATTLPGSNAHAGGTSDMVVAKFASDGTREWVQLLGGSGHDYGIGIAVDSAGDVYITGWTTAVLPGSNANVGGGDIAVAKFASNGTREWVQLLGGSGTDYGNGIAVDSAGSVYITGQTQTTLPGSNVYAGGTSDIVVAKFASNGTREWVQLLGSSGFDIGYDIALDSVGSVYITGLASATLPGSNANAGGSDMMVAKFTTSGLRIWVQLLGDSSGEDYSRGIAIDSAGGVYITGYTSSITLAGSNAHGGTYDMVVAKFASDGTREWVQLLGGSGEDEGHSIAVDSAGSVYITGYTQTTLPGSNAYAGGSNDIVVTKFT